MFLMQKQYFVAFLCDPPSPGCIMESFYTMPSSSKQGAPFSSSVGATESRGSPVVWGPFHFIIQQLVERLNDGINTLQMQYHCITADVNLKNSRPILLSGNS